MQEVAWCEVLSRLRRLSTWGWGSESDVAVGVKPEQVSELKCSEEYASAGGNVQSEEWSTSD